MIPIRDENPARTKPFVTIGLIAANVAVFLLQMLTPPEAQEAFVFEWGAIPNDISNAYHLLPALPLAWIRLLTSMFMHGGLMHLGGNMLYLWIFGNNIEDVLGHAKFLLFYLVGGLVAALSHVLFEPSSTIPMVGASGAISAVLGAYMLAYPRAKVVVLVFIVFIIRFIRVPALLMLGIWFAMQIFGFAGESGTEGGGVAWLAHIGGFVAGVLLILLAGVRPARPVRRFSSFR
ncbi:MAG: rhomboid family intramembrane serine protease [Calditrichaeota bacterium]|nr:rhomboid family intramembrane serine protease [Calditrichota bacterium]MCB9391620.1 rhomboid family intramembrane serine protease [Calditrichota bacterium]